MSRIVLRNWNHAFHGQSRFKCHFQQGDMKKNRNFARKCCAQSTVVPLTDPRETAGETFNRGILSRVWLVWSRFVKETHNSRSILSQSLDKNKNKFILFNLLFVLKETFIHFDSKQIDHVSSIKVYVYKCIQHSFFFFFLINQTFLLPVSLSLSPLFSLFKESRR